MPQEKPRPDEPINPNIDSNISYNDISVAQEILKSLLPQDVPKIPGYEMAYHYSPRKVVGGDYCDFIPIDDARTAIVVADVSGHGFSGAIVAAAIRTFFHREIKRVHTPRLLATLLNKMLYEDTPGQMFATLLFSVLDAKERTLTYINAGHPPLILRRPGAGEVALFRHESIPVGVNTGAIFQSRLVENRIPLGAGDLVMLYTDGVTDAANSQDQEFEPTFHKLVLQHGDRPLKELHQVIMDTLRLHTQKPKQDDDITLISVRVQR